MAKRKRSKKSVAKHKQSEKSKASPPVIGSPEAIAAVLTRSNLALEAPELERKAQDRLQIEVEKIEKLLKK